MGNITTPLAARPTIYRGIEMRSRLEAKWAARLDVLGFEWQYEPVCFADQSGQYLPDFRVVTDRIGDFAAAVYGDGPYSDGDGGLAAGVTWPEPRSIYIDVKGAVLRPGEVLRRMEVIFSSDASEDTELWLIEGDGERAWRWARWLYVVEFCDHGDVDYVGMGELD